MIKIITHDDLDGLGCAVLAKLAWHENVDITFVDNHNTANAYFREFMKDEWKRYETVYFTDMVFDTDLLKICPFVDRLKLFDHHHTNVRTFPYPWATVKTHMKGRATCGTELFYKYLMEEHNLSPRPYFVEVVRQYDTWTMKDEQPYQLSDMLRAIGVKPFLDLYYDRLYYKDVDKDTIFTKEERQMISFYAMTMKNLIDTCVKDVKVKRLIIDGKEYLVGILFNNFPNVSLLGNTICQTYPEIDFSLMVNLSRNHIVARSQKDTIDLGKLMSEKFDGGGVPRAAGGEFYVTDDVLDILADKLEKTVR